MKEYDIEVKETLARIVTVQANSSDEAYNKVSVMYKNEDIVLSADDFIDVSIGEDALVHSDIGPLVSDIIDYMYDDEKKHYEENPQGNHIFLKLQKLRKLL